ncbi:hypothetical protein [Prosthecobacter sp.]|uniref:hypothetical protein n=1 Tax=Prosthecobacter sp. TaxID=1965333 RepID=UPI0037845EDD
MPLDDLISGVDFADAMIGGWRYLLSSTYRLKKRREWRNVGWVWITLEIIFGVFGVLLSLGLVGLAAFAIWKSQSH